MKTVRGMRDFLPEKARKKKFIERLCADVFESYGFSPLETPIIEELSLLVKKGSAGEEITNEIYDFEDKGKRKLGLRFDLTVPLARVVASNPQLKMPFKRYQIERVYRYDRPQAKRYREFTQADVDIIGTDSLIADFECISIGCSVCSGLGIDFKIIVNSRKLLEQIAICAGVKENQLDDCFRIIDKLDKIGEKSVEQELAEKGIGKEILSLIKEKNLDNIRKLLDKNKLSLEPLQEIQNLLQLAEENKIKEFIEIDLSLARGLAYYTGIVFEIKSKDGPSIGGGGRYNKLIGTYGKQDVPAVGISFGIDRLLDNLEEKLILPVESKIFIAGISKEFSNETFKLASKIRRIGINTEIDLMNRSVSKNLDYASKKEIPFVILIGDNELKSQEFSLKNMKTGKEEKIKFNTLEKIKEVLEKE